MSFGTSIHCMDGRIQEPVSEYLKNMYNLKYIDTVTEPGPIKILSDNKDKAVIASIHRRVSISINNHGSQMISLSVHYDCAGNPAQKEEKIQQINRCAEVLKEKYSGVKIIKLWVNEKWEVEELSP